MRLKLPLRIVTLVCAVSLLAYACGDSTSPVEGKPVSLTLLPSEFTLNAVGDTKDLGPSFPGGERAIQKALVDNDFRGLESIEDVVGVPIETLLAEWAATLYLDDRGVPGLPARLDFPSWNLFDIYEGGGLPCQRAGSAAEPTRRQGVGTGPPDGGWRASANLWRDTSRPRVMASVRSQQQRDNDQDQDDHDPHKCDRAEHQPTEPFPSELSEKLENADFDDPAQPVE